MVETTLPHKQRVTALQAEFSVDTAILLTSPSAVQYYTGFVSLVPSERDGMVLITKDNTYLIHSSFSPLPSDVSWFIRFAGTSALSLGNHMAEVLKKEQLATLYIDTETMNVGEYQVLQKMELEILPVAAGKLQEFLLKQRSLKDAAEVERMQHAGLITATAVANTIAQLSVGMTEVAVKRLLEHAMEDAGASDMAFPSIIAFGANSALPHHQPGNTELVEGTVVLIDVGARVEGYCADMTRTVWFGKSPSEKFLQIESIVKRAYKAALTVVSKHHQQSTAVQLKLVDQAAREVITEAGFGAQFNHTTGHGLGLDIHEHPSVNWKSEVLVEPRLVVTIEPGIYLAGEFGYRYENTVLVGETGCVEMTRLEAK